jgi:acyl carrier protein
MKVKSDVMNVISKINTVLKTEFPALRELDLTSQTPLISAGWLDSFAVVTLVAALEEAFSIQINVEKLEFAQFETPATIASFCLETQLNQINESTRA